MKPAISFSPQAFSRTLRVLAEHAFLFTMLLIIFAATISLSVFFLALSRANSIDSSVSSDIQFRQDVLQGISKEWAKREEALKRTAVPGARNIFGGQ